MVNLREDCEDSRNTGKNLPSPVKLNGSCPAEAGIKNGNSNQVLKISAVNGKVAVKESPSVNGSCSEAPVNGVKKPAVNGVPTVNENSEKAPVKEVSAVNGDSNNKVSVNDIQTVDGKFEAQTEEISSGKAKWCDLVAAEEASLVNGNLNDKDSGICSNGSDTPSESGSWPPYTPISDSVYNDEISDEDQNGFTEVVNKRSRRKNNKPKNHRKKNTFNLPPGLSAENIRRDNVKDKNCSEKTQSPTPVQQKLLQNEILPTRIFPAIRTATKSYSSALLNGQNGNSQMRNGGSCVSSSTQNASNSNTHQNHNSSNKSVKNCNSSATNISVSQSSSDTAKTAINATSTVSCSKQSNSSTKVEMTDVSAQTDICAEKELPTNECLPPTEVNDEPANSCAPNDNVVVNDTVEEINDVPSNAASGESVADGERDGEVAVYDRCNPYSCEFPKSKVSMLIGKGGSFKKRIERETGIEIWVVDNICRPDQSIIQMTGPADRIQDAKEIINNKFHMQLKEWKGMEDNIPLSEQYFATLPELTEIYATVSSIVNPNLFWVQQLGNAQYFALEGLELRMAQHFHHNTEVPVINNPSVGNVVAVPMTAERWVRGEIVEIISELEVCVTFLDHGGVYRVPTSHLRPMRQEFLCIPFTACRCSLDGVLPTEWSLEALAEFARLCQRPALIRVTHKTPDGHYYVSMRGFDEDAQQFVSVTNTLLAKGLALAYNGPQPVDFVAEPQQ